MQKYFVSVYSATSFARSLCYIGVKVQAELFIALFCAIHCHDPPPPHITPFEKVQTRDSDTEDIPQFVWHLQWHTWQELGKKRGRKKKIENWGGVLRWDASQLHMVFHAERLCWRFFNGLKWMPGIGTPPKTPTQKLKAQIPETKGQMRSLSVGPLWCGGSAYGQVERFLFLYSDSDSDAES